MEYNELYTLMSRMWAKAHKYQTLIESTERRLRKFGWRRWIFVRRFSRVRATLQRYENSRLTFASLALGISRKIYVHRKDDGSKSRLDH